MIYFKYKYLRHEGLTVPRIAVQKKPLVKKFLIYFRESAIFTKWN